MKKVEENKKPRGNKKGYKDWLDPMSTPFDMGRYL
jgi:hypothetical protein